MLFAARWVQLEVIILSEVSQKGETNTIRYHFFVESKVLHKCTYPQNKKTTDIENSYGYHGGRVGRGMEWELGIIGRANNKVLLNSTGNYSQYPVINHNGKEYKTCPYV